MSQCPKCNSHNLRRSRTRSRWERWRKEITGRRPYRCRACDWRGWLPISVGDAIEAREAARRKAADPPNLQGTAFARNLQRLTLDVKQLDRFHQTTDEDSDS
ncbi:MAG: hypothetical protein A3H29_15860 [Acidobacteria bacterium RIFCSPLOWO2_02_FULL_67_21]|nr:MAG: hypothetical protein A3H29_15860 [Acidobacteria bacterium RIFCSPLOWO2_02_FULL_67_21]